MGLVKFVWYNHTTILENSKINRPVKETALWARPGPLSPRQLKAP